MSSNSADHHELTLGSYLARRAPYLAVPALLIVAAVAAALVAVLEAYGVSTPVAHPALISLVCTAAAVLVHRAFEGHMVDAA